MAKNPVSSTVSPRASRAARDRHEIEIRERARRTAAAAGLVVLAVLCLSVLDATSKSLATRYPVPFVVWARYAVQVVALVLWLGPRIGAQMLATGRHALHFVRGVVLVGASLFVVLAFRRMPLADATALNYTSPALVMVLAVFALHERMTAQRVMFVLAGVIGMLLIVRPGTEVFDAAALFAIAGAGCHAAYMILTRKLAGEDARVLLFYGTIVSALATSCLLPTFDLPASMSGLDLALLASTGVLGAAGHFMFIGALQRAPASTVSPFTYAQLIFATLIGWVVFGQLPDRWTVLGMAIVAGSGMLALWYERRRTFDRLAEVPAAE